MIHKLILLFFAIGFYGCSNGQASQHVIQQQQEEAKAIAVRTSLKAKEALAFCTANDYDTQYCFLVDMNIHSGKNRFFIYDMKGDSILEENIVSHGCGNRPWSMDWTKKSPKFSNTPDSHLSSLGKYKIGERGYSNWGIHINYKLHGLDSSNSNAYKRFIVLHSWDMIPNNEVYPNGCPEGHGCPAVSNDFMRKLDARLKKSKKPVLMWIYK